MLYDNITFGQSFLLANTIDDFLPPYPQEVRIPSPSEWHSTEAQPLRPGYHLIHYPPSSKLSELLPDNTETDQSPGEPFVRRMWAGGRLEFFPDRRNTLRMGTGVISTCTEAISDVKIKGNEGDEKIYVTIDRRMSSQFRMKDKFGQSIYRDSTADKTEDEVRARMQEGVECGVIEQRNIVFMRERTPVQAADAAKKPGKVVRAPHKPTFSHSLTPTASLLFRFSALTWNAHSIHLDKHFCREIEGHRNLLFHGPLSLVMVVELLQRHLASQGLMRIRGGMSAPSRTISTIEYRNLAPLYADEELRICGRKKDKGNYDLWIENKDGGMCVRATATTHDCTKFDKVE
jgi:hydroxyacyl-ACP dehydratase HTD2-like protein with hotdog domain